MLPARRPSLTTWPKRPNRNRLPPPPFSHDGALVRRVARRRRAPGMRDGYLRGALSRPATQRQMEVLAAFVAAGGSVQGAAVVGIRPSTVKRHLADLRARSGLTTEQLIYAGRASGRLVVPSLEDEQGTLAVSGPRASGPPARRRSQDAHPRPASGSPPPVAAARSAIRAPAHPGQRSGRLHARPRWP